MALATPALRAAGQELGIVRVRGIDRVVEVLDVVEPDRRGDEFLLLGSAPAAEAEEQGDEEKWP
ncbi:MAG: hypothetical protein IPI41_05265 [Flavobacteriales bacterium]|nr:hypothetical protein [Flavobacteriales bacterium]